MKDACVKILSWFRDAFQKEKHAEFYLEILKYVQFALDTYSLEKRVERKDEVFVLAFSQGKLEHSIEIIEDIGVNHGYVKNIFSRILWQVTGPYKTMIFIFVVDRQTNKIYAKFIETANKGGKFDHYEINEKYNQPGIYLAKDVFLPFSFIDLSWFSVDL